MINIVDRLLELRYSVQEGEIFQAAYDDGELVCHLVSEEIDQLLKEITK